MDELVYAYRMEIKRNELLTDMTTWMSLKSNVVNERSQVQKSYTMYI